MITQEELNDKVVKLMAMAGTEGGSYSLWSVNQIVHGLREAVPGATADKVKTALETLVSDGTVKERLPSREKDPMQYVLANKVPAPEPLNQSPIAARRDIGDEEDDPRRTAVVVRTVPVDQAGSTRDRLKNAEEVMSELNKVVSSLQEKHKELSRELGTTRGDLEDWKGDVRSLRVRIRAVEEDVKKLVETIVSFVKEPDKKDDTRKTVPDSVMVASIIKMSNRWEQHASDLESEEDRYSASEWTRAEGMAEGFRQCARDVRRMLEKTVDTEDRRVKYYPNIVGMSSGPDGGSYDE